MARKKASQMTSQEIKMVDEDLFDFSDPTEEEAISPIEEARPEDYMLEFRRAHGRWFLASVKNLDSGAVISVSDLPGKLNDALDGYFTA